MQMFRRIFNHLRGINQPPLGRWCLKDKSKNDWKVDTANTDHCGTCAYEESKPLPKIKLLPDPQSIKMNQKINRLK